MIARFDRRRIRAGLLAALALAACGGETAPEAPPRPVRTIEVVSGAGGRARTFSGVTRAGVESGLSFRVPGTLVTLPVAVGEAVGRGRTIAALDPADYRLRVREAEAGLAQARAAARNAQATYDRTRDLYETESASKSQLDAARASAESAGATVEAAESRLALARSQLAYTVLRSPLDGAITALPVEINENVRSGQTIAVLASSDVLEVEVGIPQTLIAALRPGSPATVRLDALPGRELPGLVSEVGAAATGAGATFPVRVRIEEGAETARPGMAASVTFAFPAAGDGGAILVPAVAVGEDAAGRFVWIVEPAADGLGTVSRRAVEVGALTGSGLEIGGGLADGERVVVAGVSRIRDGQTVRLDEAGP